MASSAKDIQLRELKDTVSLRAKKGRLISPASSTYLMKLSRNRIFPDSMRRKRLL